MIYLDNQSSTKIDKRVLKAMEPYLTEHFANPAAAHFAAEEPRQAIEMARNNVSYLIKAKPENLYFTNSATESNNIVLQGRLANHRKNSNNAAIIITSNIEHSSVSKTLQNMWSKDNLFFNQTLKINSNGEIDLDKLNHTIKNYFSNRVILVSIIAASNEIGVINNLSDIGAICKRHNVLFHTDATQAIGKVDIDVNAMNIFALTFNAHKINGPKGVGALFVRNPNLVEPLIHGGYQNTFSSGTQNVPAIVGFGEACDILRKEGKKENERISYRRDLLWRNLSSSIPDIFINGTMKNRLPNNLNITIKGVKAEILVKGMSDVAVSGGSACNSGNLEPSLVILALGTPYPDCAIRISLGRFTTMADCEYAAKKIKDIVESVRCNNETKI